MTSTKNSITKILFGIFTMTALASCENDGYDEYKAETTPSIEMNGEWYIDISDANGVIAQHAKHVTYDTNNGDNTMWINDNKTGYWMKGKLNVEPKTLTFSATNEPNIIDSGTFTVTEGKILKGVAHSRAGNVTDSIYFKGEFSYDPGHILIFAGHKRTGFLEDNY
ncbi:MAG: lipid-binding protein [Flavobacterium sp.]